MEDLVYTVEEVQDLLKCSRTQTYKIMNSKTFPSFRIGKRLYVKRDDFIRYLDYLKKNRK